MGTLTLVVPSLPQLWTIVGLYYFPGIVQSFCAEATRLGCEPSLIGRSKDAFLSTATEFDGIAGAACLLISPEDVSAVEGLRDMNIEAVAINAYHGRRTISYVAADQMLDRRITKTGKRETILVPTQLIKRGSVAPAL